MFGKVKTWLGIEGVKMSIEVSQYFSLSKGTIEGELAFVSMSKQVITQVDIALIEKYTRGRRKHKKSSEYEMGAATYTEALNVIPGEKVFLPFTITFDTIKSEIDLLGERNFITRGLTLAAKTLKGVKSEYRLEAKARVKGTALHPVATHILKAEK